MSYSVQDRENITKQTKWVVNLVEADFFDIRYNEYKWTREQISSDGVLLPDFKKWMDELIKSKSFDWKHFCKTNGMEKMLSYIEDTNNLDDRVIRFPEDYLYLTNDGVIGIKISRLNIRHTYDVDKKKSYREKYFLLHINENGEYYHDSNIYYNSRKEYLTDYSFVDGIFILNK